MSTNDGGHNIRLLVGSREDEMNALDALGPLTRRAIHELPVRMAAIPILQELQAFEKRELEKIPEDRRHLYQIRFSDPRLDQHVADGIRAAAKVALMEQLSEEDADRGIKPILARVSVKSIREQRRSLRKVRW